MPRTSLVSVGAKNPLLSDLFFFNNNLSSCRYPKSSGNYARLPMNFNVSTFLLNPTRTHLFFALGYLTNTLINSLSRHQPKKRVNRPRVCFLIDVNARSLPINRDQFCLSHAMTTIHCLSIVLRVEIDIM